MKKLNTKIWDSDDSLKKEIRKNLLRVANDFVKFLKIKNLKVIDVTFTGSLANYFWHSKSDIDIHIVVDLSNFSSNAVFIEEYLMSKKFVWNTNHAIKIYGFEVEIYPEIKGSNPETNGVFSLVKNKWVVKPIESSSTHNKNELNTKVNNIRLEILNLEEKSKKCNKSSCEKLIKQCEKLMHRLRDKRYIALQEIGEMAIDNLVYKELRKSGLLEKLSKMKYSIYDSMFTLENIYIKNKNIILEVGNKYILNRNIGILHSNKDDKIRLFKIENNNIYYRDIRNRKQYNISEEELKEFIDKDFIKLIK